MGDRAALTRLRREYSNIQGEKIPHIVARPTEKNMLIWYYVLHDLPTETPYSGGVYWGKLVFPKEFPFKPPAIYMLTPSGRFETNSRLCLSMSDFHPETWNPSWRIESILIGLVSFMLDIAEPRTTGGVHTSPARRREYAKASFDFNRENAEFRDLFPEFCDEAKRHPQGGFFLDRAAASSSASQASPSSASAAGRSVGGVAERSQEEQPEQRRAPQGGGGGMLPSALLALSVLVLLLSCWLLRPSTASPLGTTAAAGHRPPGAA